MVKIKDIKKMKFDFGENSINRNVETFKNSISKGPFKNVPKNKMNKKTNGNIYNDAVWQAYIDICRTFKNINNTSTNKKAFDDLADKIENYMNGYSDYNHKQWCEEFIDDIKKYNSCDITYGQAQKVVNMAFKYLYCCTGLDKSKFKSCHMPLDTNIIRWYCACSGSKLTTLKELDYNQYIEIQDNIKSIVKNGMLKKEFVIWNALR